MSSTREAPRTPAETLTELKSLLSGKLPETFVFNGAVIQLSQRFNEDTLPGRRKEYDLSGRATGTRDAWQQYWKEVFTFQQGNNTVEITVSPAVFLLTDQDGRGGKGSYQTQNEYVMIGVKRSGKREYYTVDATKNDLPQEVEALLLAMLEAAKTYNPNVGGLHIEEEGYGKKAMDVLEDRVEE